VVRISGPKAEAAIQVLADRLPEPRKAALAQLRHGDELLDTALVIRFPAPATATGEDVAELHLHGGRSVVAGVLAALESIEGLRQAEPGEFTRRAFENGRIDLAEAEGLADLLEAETESQRRNALALAGGALSRQVEAWQEQLLALAATVEAALDFSDEDDVVPLPGDFPAQLATLRDEMADWLKRPSAERLKDGVRVVIGGPPNAGKSSLLNALIGREAAITSAVSGTTRDVIEAPTAIAGIPFLLIDTAGIRESSDEIEAAGVERAKAHLGASDILLWLGDPSEAPSGAVLVHPKTDLVPPAQRVDAKVSALTGEGLDELTHLLIERSRQLLPREGEVALNARHREALARAEHSLTDAAEQADLLIVAEALRHGLAALDRLTGRAGVEDMLDALFGRFCIGK
jgi:tRNA modification GTPase